MHLLKNSQTLFALHLVYLLHLTRLIFLVSLCSGKYPASIQPVWKFPGSESTRSSSYCFSFTTQQAPKTDAILTDAFVEHENKQVLMTVMDEAGFQMVLLQMYAGSSHNAVTTASNTWISYVWDANCASWAVLAFSVKAACWEADESYWTVLVQSDRWTLQVNKEPVWLIQPSDGLEACL